ncbi:hypothetical protein PC128_g16569 [Phytophthora cactorum]|nr:hypothetical protein PC128_g16569 [Phytophthora cactorum]
MQRVYYYKGRKQSLDDVANNFRAYYRLENGFVYVAKSADMIHTFRNTILGDYITMSGGISSNTKQEKLGPTRLLTVFREIQKCTLPSSVQTDRALGEFIDLLNGVFPYPSTEPSDFNFYLFHLNRYFSDKERFLKDIEGFDPYEAMILWRDSEDILRFYQLENVITLGFDSKIDRFQGFYVEETKCGGGDDGSENEVDPQLEGHFGGATQPPAEPENLDQEVISAPALPANEESVEPKQEPQEEHQEEHQEEEEFPDKGPTNDKKTDSDVLLLSYPMAFTRNEESKQEDNEPEQDETFVPAMPKNEQDEEFKRKETYTPARSKETVEATFVREAGMITVEQLYKEDPDRIGKRQADRGMMNPA